MRAAFLIIRSLGDAIQTLPSLDGGVFFVGDVRSHLLIQIRQSVTFLVVAILIVLDATYAPAQPTIMWLRVIDDPDVEVINGACTTPDGGIVLCGHITVGHGDNYIGFLYKLDGRGQVLWYRTYNDQTLDIIQHVKSTADGGFITIWETSSGTTIRKLDGEGDPKWEHLTTTLSPGVSLAQTSDGGYVYAGSYRDIEHGRTELGVVKLDALGNVMWSRRYPIEFHPSWCDGGSVKEAQDNGLLLTSTITLLNDSALSRIVIIRTDAAGVPIWTREISDSIANYNGVGI
jgi:hypothetical protein